MMRARLSKDRRYAVCGARPDCGERFAERIKLSPELRVWNPSWHAGLWILPGFVRSQDQTFRMSTRVRARISQGKRPAYRRAPGGTEQKIPDPALGVSMLTVYPVIVECPACGRAQVLAVDALDLAPVAETVLIPDRRTWELFQRAKRSAEVADILRGLRG